MVWPRPGDGEPERLGQVFNRYRHNPRRVAAWDAGNAGNAAIRDELARAVLAARTDADPDALLLDAGCGSGWWLERLLAEAIVPARLIGVDLLAARVDAARARVPDVTVLRGDIRALPLARDSCALVTLFTVLSGMASAADVHAALLEARRVLVPGGAVIIWEPRVLTVNPDTRLIRLRDLRRALGSSVRPRSITLAPPLARRAGRAYGALVALPALRTHRLVIARP